MARIGLFVCDILNTFTWARSKSFFEEVELSNPNYQEAIHELVQRLEKIINDKNLDELVFSFSTSWSFGSISLYLRQLKPHLVGTKIKLGSQCAGDTCYDVTGKKLYSYLYDFLNKEREIVNQIKVLQETGEVVWVGYADDETFPNSIESIINNFPNIPEVHGFIPKSGDFSEFEQKTLESDFTSVCGYCNINGLLKCLETYFKMETYKIVTPNPNSEGLTVNTHAKTELLP